VWSYSQLDALRVKIEGCPSFRRIVVAVDPPASTGDMATGRMPDECGIIVAGLGEDGHGYVLDDATTRGMSPNQWAKRAIETYALWNADAMVVEINQGGNMVKNTIEQVNQRVTHLPVLNIREVRAHEGKVLRAEPISALYEQGKVHHVRTFGTLEDQMTNFTIDFDPKKSGYSPDRLDAMVYAIKELMVKGAPAYVGRMRMF
jgi:predicted phage terminase large subunit-like protein